MLRNARCLGCLMIFLLVPALETTAQDKEHRFEIAGLFSLIQDKPVDRNVTLPGFGARFAFNAAKYMALEAETLFYQEKDFGRPSPGGLAMTGFAKVNYNGPAMVDVFGVKAGVRSRRIGLFAKARPGFAMFHPVYDCPSGSTSASQCAEIRKKEFAMDLGGVFEGYLPHGLLVRVDAGDTYLRFGPTSMLYAGSGLPWINYPYPANNRHRLHLNMGIGVRF